MAIFLTVVTVVVLMPMGICVVEWVAALVPGRRQTTPAGDERPHVAVIVPACNEEFTITTALSSIAPQLAPEDQLLVVADNCSDNTAAVAHGLGATVIERNAPDRRGKGYAIAYGLDFLSLAPPEVVIVIDADSTVHDGAIARLARRASAVERPVQACYLLDLPPKPSVIDRISGFAFCVKNLVRMQGLHRLGLPSLLTGNGMALPWTVACRISWAGESVVEDMRFAVDAAVAGYPPLFCGDALVTGYLPQEEEAKRSQRTRWEHGHLSTLFGHVPRLVLASLMQRKLGLLALAFDLAVPPLALLCLLWILMLAPAVAAGVWADFWLPIVLLVVGAGVFGVVALGVWWRFGRSYLPATTLFALPVYLMWKVPIYITFLVKPQREWVRTARSTGRAGQGHIDDAGEPTDCGHRRMRTSSMPTSLPVIELRGARLHAIREAVCAGVIMDALDQDQGGVVITMNLDHLRRFGQDINFACLCAQATLVVADGMPIVWASRLQNTPLPERVNGTNLIWTLSAAAAARGRSTYFLGGATGAAAATATALQQRYPGLIVAGVSSPAVGFEQRDADMTSLIAAIEAAQPDIIYVALGSPKQDILIARLRPLLPHAWWLGVGGAFSFIGGQHPRAPLWMQHGGLEWLHRLAQEPRRLAKRYLVSGIPFAVGLFIHAAIKRLQ